MENSLHSSSPNNGTHQTPYEWNQTKQNKARPTRKTKAHTCDKEKQKPQKVAATTTTGGSHNKNKRQLRLRAGRKLKSKHKNSRASHAITVVVPKRE